MRCLVLCEIVSLQNLQLLENLRSFYPNVVQADSLKRQKLNYEDDHTPSQCGDFFLCSYTTARLTSRRASIVFKW